MAKMMADIADFHTRFGLAYNGVPRILSDEMNDFRLTCMKEELKEYEDAVADGDLAAQLDALVDLVYFTLGTAYLQGFDFDEAWNRVQRANMQKVRCEVPYDSKRGSTFDVIKPPGWTPPILEDLVPKDHSKKPTWDEYYLAFLPIIAARASCGRGRSGSIIVDKNNYPLATGYVGAPSGMADCDSSGHLFDETGKHCVRTIHAEMNAIAAAARRGCSLEGATIYCKMFPCWECAKLIDQVGIVRVVAQYDYQASSRSKELFNNKHIAWTIYTPELASYESCDSKNS